MKKVEIFVLLDCPYCVKAKKAVDERLMKAKKLTMQMNTIITMFPLYITRGKSSLKPIREILWRK